VPDVVDVELVPSGAVVSATSRSTATDTLGVPDVVDVELAPSSPSSPQLATSEPTITITANDQAVWCDLIPGIVTSDLTGGTAAR
jgi:hypothetical protein